MSTAIIAGYAAIVATASLLWQVFVWWRSQQSRVTVTVNGGFPAGPDMPDEEWLIVTVVNAEDHQIRVNSAGIYLQDGSGRQMLAMGPPFATIPGDVRAHDSGMTYFQIHEVEAAGIDLKKPVRAWANLADGRRVESEAGSVFSG